MKLLIAITLVVTAPILFAQDSVEISANSSEAMVLFQANRTNMSSVQENDYPIMGAVFAKNSHVDLNEVKETCNKFENIEERNRKLPICELLD